MTHEQYQALLDPYAEAIATMALNLGDSERYQQALTDAVKAKEALWQAIRSDQPE